MIEFWDSSVWGWIMIFGVLFASLLVGNILKRRVPFLKGSLIPTSVLGGAVLLLIAAIYKWITGEVMFDTAIFENNGTEKLEIITYHTLALGFIASTFKSTNKKLTRGRSTEIFNTGVTTVATYLLQGIFGFVIAFIATLFIKDFFVAAGALLPFGFGQGTGQALNYGIIYEGTGRFDGGANFGLTVAALGFLSASLGGVVHLIVMKRRGKLVYSKRNDGSLHSESIESENEIPMTESIDKMTIQLAFIFVAYVISYGIIAGLSKVLPSFASVLYGFNFIVGVLVAIVMKLVLNFLLKKKLITRKYTNNFLMTRVSNFCFDLMVVAGVAAIRLDKLNNYWGVIIAFAIAGIVVTYVYNRIVAKLLFRDYYEEQFLMMYGMLTGTASTGTILLREVDDDFRTPASDNMVYQNFPAMVLGFPLMFLAKLAIDKPLLTLIIFIVFFLVLNVVLFRSFIFKKRAKGKEDSENK